jgi:hypothetical protein
MFRINIHAGSPVVARGNENHSTDFRRSLEMVPTWNFQEHTLWSPLKKRLIEVFFHFGESVYCIVMKKFVPLVLIGLGWVTFIAINIISVYYSLYWFVWWLDIAMHISGGFLIVATWYQIQKLGAFPRLMRHGWFRPLVILVVAMVVWELFEFRFGLITEYDYVSDTAFDLINGLIGGLIASWVSRSRTILK